jgi:hypothetical protein
MLERAARVVGGLELIVERDDELVMLQFARQGLARQMIVAGRHRLFGFLLPELSLLLVPESLFFNQFFVCDHLGRFLRRLADRLLHLPHCLTQHFLRIFKTLGHFVEVGGNNVADPLKESHLIPHF